jgi:hypothetical protein
MLKVEGNTSAQKVNSSLSSRGASKVPSISKAISAKMQKRSPVTIPHSGPLGNDPVSSPNFDPSFGSFHFSPHSDMTVASQDSIATTGLGHACQAKGQHDSAGVAQQIRRLDGIMFPSNDPLAYPNQPRADFGMHGPSLHPNPGDMLQHDPTSYYVPHLYDGIEGHLLGPLPPYLMQSQGGPGIPFPNQMYSDPMLSSQHMHPSPLRSHPQGLQLEQEQLRQQPREYDHMLANTSWQSMFP